MIAAAQAIGGLGMGFFGAVWQTTLQQHVPEEALSRVSAWDWMGSFAFLPLGLILAGPVSDAIGISTTLWISVGYLVVSTAGRAARAECPEPPPARRAGADDRSGAPGDHRRARLEAFHG